MLAAGDLSVGAVAWMILAAVIVGYSKTALGGLAAISVAIFADLLPARQSTAAILLLLIVGDVIACWHYRRDADWPLVRRLLPAVVVGLVLGTAFLRVVDDRLLKRSIAVIILVLVGLQLWLKRRGDAIAADAHHHPAAAWSAGTAAGFTTMTANAAGAVMALYLSIFMGGTVIGAPLLGWIADTAGPRWSLATGAASGSSCPVTPTTRSR